MTDCCSHIFFSRRACRVAISELFDLPPGAYSPGMLVSALKQLGFDLVLDTNTAADLTICEEVTELLRRLPQTPANGNNDNTGLPLFTSCCPGWMNWIQKIDPELAPYISTCKSPHIMYGSVVKKFGTELMGTTNSSIYFTSIMPCILKRGESDRPAFANGDGVRDVDNVITTRDLGQLLKLKEIDPLQCKDVPFDSPFQQEQQEQDGTGTGAGQLFGASGGVMEAAVRTVHELVTGQELPVLELDAVRGLDGVKEAVVPLYTKEDTDKKNGMDLRVAVVSGLGNAKKLIQKLKDGTVQYDFVEVMACPGGCINGGGQPRSAGSNKSKDGPTVVEKRLAAIYELDRSLPRRKSHDNPTVQKLYEKYLNGYGGEQAHKVLHVEPIYGETPPKPPTDK